MSFTAVFSGKIYLSHKQMTNTLDTKNSITQLYFILGTAELRWNFSSWYLQISSSAMVKTHFLLVDLCISGASLGIGHLCMLRNIFRIYIDEHCKKPSNKAETTETPAGIWAKNWCLEASLVSRVNEYNSQWFTIRRYLRYIDVKVS